MLRKYVKDGTVDLCYIDPPFNSKRNYNQIYNRVGKEDKAQAQAFIDTWTWDVIADKGFEEIMNNYNGLFTAQTISLISGLKNVLGEDSLLAYLVSMTLRVVEIHRVLKSTGSFYFHCDPTASHYLKLILDSIFCPRKGDFVNEIIWCYKSRHFAKTHFGRKHDVIFLYSKSEKFTFNWESILRALSPVTIKKFKYQDENGLYRLNGRGIKGSPIQSAKDVDPKWEKTNPELTVRDYLKEGVPIEDYWYIEIINQSAKERLGYPTQKPEELLEKMIKASSNKGDVILDAYCGCGTTIAVAEKLHRKWIGIDITYQSISLILKRLEDNIGKTILANIELNGVPEDFASAEALAQKKDDRTRKEFEKWIILTYSNNRAIINEQKGGDKGIDGLSFIPERDKNTDVQPRKIIFSVKSDKVLHPSYIRDLKGVMERDEAVMGIFLCLYEPTKGMREEAKKAGIYKSNFTNLEYPKFRIVTAQDILNGARLDTPVFEVVKKAVHKGKENQNQIVIDEFYNEGDDSEQQKMDL